MREVSCSQIATLSQIYVQFLVLGKGDVCILLAEGQAVLSPNTTIINSCCYHQEIICCSNSFQSWYQSETVLTCQSFSSNFYFFFLFFPPGSRSFLSCNLGDSGLNPRGHCGLFVIFSSLFSVRRKQCAGSLHACYWMRKIVLGFLWTPLL